MRLMLAALLGVLVITPAVAGEPPAELLEILARGRAALENFDYPVALAVYEEAVQAHRAGRYDLERVQVRRALAAAFEGKAAAHLGNGEIPQVSEMLAAALAVEPPFRPDPMVNSPRLLEIFERVRRETVGFLSVQTDPEGCSVWINGRHVGESPLEGLPWLAGPVEVRLQKAGFDPEQISTEITAGVMEAIHQGLSANARLFIFRTSPPGVRILVDGEDRAVTDGPASADDAETFAFEAEKLSRPIEMLLSPGRHRVRFELPCHEPWVESIQVEAHAEPLDYKPMVMEKKVGRVTLHSTPPGATVRIDSAGGKVFETMQDVGRTPVTVEQVCVGERRIELVGEKRGKWSGVFTLAADEHREVNETLRPTLVFLGVLPGAGAPEDAVGSATARVQEKLGTIRAYNTVVVRNPGALDPSAESMFPPGNAAAVTAIADQLDADLLLLGRVREERLTPILELYLFSRHHPRPEWRAAPMDDLRAIDEFLAQLGRSPRMQRPWLGMLALDIDDDRPVVARLAPGGPAEAAGVALGDRVLTLGEHPIVDVTSLVLALDDLAVLRSGRDVSLRVRRADSEIEMPITLGATPVLIGANHPGVLYNKRLVDLDYMAAEETGTQRSIVLLNRAMAFIHFGHFDLAVRDALGGVELPPGVGISAGTVDYVRGLCYERLGIDDRARAAFESAAVAAAATLESHDGPAVAPLARFHLERLNSRGAGLGRP